MTFGRSRATIDSLIETAMSFSLDKDVGNTVIYNIDSSYGSGKLLVVFSLVLILTRWI